MKVFEISNKEKKDGRRSFKMTLHTIYPDSCIDTVEGVGTQYNENGITWIRKYCEKALPTIIGSSLRCEFLDEERTELNGHGMTGTKDGEPIFEDAVVIGTFTNAYIDTIETENGSVEVVIGEGEIDSQCYHNFVEKLEEDLENGAYPKASVEIMRLDDNDEIQYLYGYKDEGRIPTVFRYSGCALLGIPPADENSYLFELNNEVKKEEENSMNEEQIKAIVKAVVSELSDSSDAIAKAKDECNAEIAKAKEETATAVAEKNDVIAESEQIKAALEQVRKEYRELDEKWTQLEKEYKALQKALGQAQARERIAGLDNALKDFSEDEKAVAKEDIEAYKADPKSEAEINSIVNKIWANIGKNAKANMASDKDESANIVDIFGDIDTDDEEISIF